MISRRLSETSRLRPRLQRQRGMGTLRKSLATEQVDRVERRTTKNVGEARNRYVERNTPGDENEGIKRATRWAQLKVRYQSKGDRKDHQV